MGALFNMNWGWIILYYTDVYHGKYHGINLVHPCSSPIYTIDVQWVK